MGRKKVIKPHGGILIDRVLKGSKRTQTIQKAKKYYHIKLSHEHIQEVTNIATGVFSPLKGFLTKTELKSVLNRKRLPAGRHGLPNGTPWTIPIVLDIPQWVSSDIRRHKHLTLVDEKDKTIAVMTIKDIYRYDKRDFAKKVYGTLDAAHPGVAKVMSMGDYLIGGSIQLVNMPDYVFKKYTLTPLQTREKFKKLGWSRVVAFQTRNVPHAGHEYIQTTALSYVNGLFINPVIGRKKKGDFKDRVILDAYQALIKNYYSKDQEIKLETTPGKYKQIIEKLRPRAKELSINSMEVKDNKLVIYTTSAERLLHQVLHIVEELDEILLDVVVEKPSLQEVLEKLKPERRE